MLFNSLHFLVFFLLVTTGYFALPFKHRWKLILTASCYFYMVFMPVYILILGFTIVVDYFVGLWLEKEHRPANRKWILIISLIVNVGVLAFFKYYNFLNENLSAFLNVIGYQNSIPDLSILLPIGLSFHTFQAMSYTIEVYRGKHPAEKHFGIYALYVMYYPQLVAGPIERPQNVLWQYHAPHTFDYSRVSLGLKLMLWGFFKKVVVADRLAPLVDYVYNDPTGYAGLPLIMATILFAFQIYADFSGYSDIAIGASAVMGIKLMTNFRQPYFAASVTEFWKRWHISLSTWFRDYLYIPLGGNRYGKWKHMRNLMITFLISGIWHGANWTFVVWGGLHGVFLILEQLFRNKNALRSDTFEISLRRFFWMLLTFVLVSISWVFFRAVSIHDAMYIITHMFSNISFSGEALQQLLLGGEKYTWVMVLIGLGTMFTVEFLQQGRSISNWVASQSTPVRWSLYLILVLMTIGLGQFETATQFIYFQF